MKLKLKAEHFFLPGIFLLYIIMQFNFYSARGVLVGILAIVYVVLYKKKLNKIRLNNISIWFNILMLYLTIITAIGYANDNIQNIYYYINNCINLFVIGGISIYIISSKENIRSFYVLIRALTVFLIFFGIIEYLTRQNFTLRFIDSNSYYQDYLKVKGRIFSIFQHPIGYAVYLNTAFVISLIYPFKKKGYDILYKIVIIINIYLTQSRTALVALIIAFVLSKVLNSAQIRKTQKKKYISRNKIIIFGIFGLIVLVLCLLNYKYISAIFANIYSSITSKFSMKDQGVRLEILKNYVLYLKRMNIRQIIFGKGVGYSYNWMRCNGVPSNMGVWTETTDNMYITMLLDGGILAVIIFLWLPFNVIKKMFKNKEMSKEQLIGCINIFLISFEIFLLEGLFWNTIFFIFALSISSVFIEDNKIES